MVLLFLSVALPLPHAGYRQRPTSPLGFSVVRK
jgi:hypothetical protein